MANDGLTYLDNLLRGQQGPTGPQGPQGPAGSGGDPLIVLTPFGSKFADEADIVLKDERPLDTEFGGVNYYAQNCVLGAGGSTTVTLSGTTAMLSGCSFATSGDDTYTFVFSGSAGTVSMDPVTYRRYTPGAGGAILITNGQAVEVSPPLNTIAYVDASATHTADGTQDAPYVVVQDALTAGFTSLYLTPGTYAGDFTVSTGAVSIYGLAPGAHITGTIFVTGAASISLHDLTWDQIGSSGTNAAGTIYSYNCAGGGVSGDDATCTVYVIGAPVTSGTTPLSSVDDLDSIAMCFASNTIFTGNASGMTQQFFADNCSFDVFPGTPPVTAFRDCTFGDNTPGNSEGYVTSVFDATVLTTLDLGSLSENSILKVFAWDDYVTLVDKGSLTADGVTLVTSSNASFLWQRLGIPSIKNSKVAAWWIDGSTGNDANDGQSTGTKIKTYEELSRRLCPNGAVCTIAQDVAVSVDNMSSGILRLDLLFPSTNVFTVSGAFTSTADITTSGVTNTTVGSVRGEITTGSGTFVTKKRIRATSGTHTGAIAFSTGLNGGATDTFVSRWNDSGLNEANLTTGDKVQVDTLTNHVTMLDLRVRGNGATLSGRIVIQDLIIDNGGTFWGNKSSRFAIALYRCELATASPTPKYFGTCAFLSTRATGAIEYRGGLMAFAGCSFQAPQTFTDNAAAYFTQGCVADAGSLLAIDKTTFYFAANSSADFEFENGTGSLTAITLFPGCTAYAESSGALWGLTGNYLVGIKVHSNASFTYVTVPSIPSTTNAIIGGTSKAWGALPYVETTNLANIVADA